MNLHSGGQPSGRTPAGSRLILRLGRAPAGPQLRCTAGWQPCPRLWGPGAHAHRHRPPAGLSHRTRPHEALYYSYRWAGTARCCSSAPERTKYALQHSTKIEDSYQGSFTLSHHASNCRPSASKKAEAAESKKAEAGESEKAEASESKSTDYWAGPGKRVASIARESALLLYSAIIDNTLVVLLQTLQVWLPSALAMSPL